MKNTRLSKRNLMLSTYSTQEGAMDTKDYFQAIPDLNEDMISPEFHTYTTVWMKSRMPEAYKELKARFKSIEGEIYAQHESNGADF